MTADYYADPYVRLIQGDVLATLATLEAGSVHCVVTSPPLTLHAEKVEQREGVR